MFNQQDNLRKVWYGLREFETRDLTSRYFKARHDRSLSSKKSRQITSNFIQAREYFRNAAAADITVRPLLQYYGVSAFSRGLVLFLDAYSSESAIAPSHGLIPIKWQEVLADGSAGIEDLRVSISKGVFHQLLAVTNNTFCYRANSTRVNMRIRTSIPDLESQFTFKDIASRIPDVSEHYETYIGKKNPFLHLVATKTDDENNQYEIVIKENPEDVSLDIYFPADMCPNRKVTQDNHGSHVQYDQPFTPFFAQLYSSHFAISDVVLYGPLKSGNYFNPLAACYMISYILGMLARYYPSTWVGLARSEKGDAIYPLVTRMMDWIQETFPWMILDLLHEDLDF